MTDKNVLQFLKTWNGVGDISQSFQQYLKETQGGLTCFSGALSKAKGVLKGFGAALGSMAINWAIGQAIGWVSKKIDEAIVTNEEYLEQQDEIISKAEETISATESRISALEGLQEKIEATNGVQSEMLKLSKDINTVLGESSSKILEQAGAYKLLNVQIQREIELEEDRQNKANQEKQDASWNKARKITVSETEGINEDLTFSQLQKKGWYQDNADDVHFESIFNDKLEAFLNDAGELSVESLAQIYESAIESYNLQVGTTKLKIKEKEFVNSFNDALENLYVVFDTPLNNGEGFLTKYDKQKIIEQMYLRTGGDSRLLDDQWKENIFSIFESLDAEGEVVNNLFTEYTEALKDDIWGNEDAIYNKLIDKFADMKSKNPIIASILEDFFNDIINKLAPDGAVTTEQGIEKFAPMVKRAVNGAEEAKRKNQDLGKLDFFNGLSDKLKNTIVHTEIPEDVKNGTKQQFIGWVNELQAEIQEDTPKVLFDIDFDSQKETIDSFQSKLSSLGDTYSKLLNGNYTGSELIDMLQELQAAGANLSTLESIQDLDEAILELNTDNVDSLLESLNVNPTSGLADYLRTVADEAIKVTSALEGTTGALFNIQNGYTTLSGALEEYNENGFLTIDTLNKVLTLEPEYLSCLIDENGQLTINREAYIQLAKAQIKKAKQAIIDEAAVKMTQLAHEGLRASTRLAELSQINFANVLPKVRKPMQDLCVGYNDTAESILAVAGAQAELSILSGTTTIEDVEKIYSSLYSIQKKYGDEIRSDMYAKLKLADASEEEIDSVFSSISGSSTGKSSSSTSDNALDAIHKLIDLRIQMIKDMKQKEIDAIQKIIDAEKEKLDAIKETIDARKEAIQVLKEEEEHEDELAEKNKAVSDIQSQLDSLSRDNSASAAKKRRELEEELAEAQKDLADYISDYEYNQAVDALDKEAESAEKAYEEEEKRLQSQIDSIQSYIDNEKQLYQDAMNDINGMSNKLFEDMKRWGEETTGEVWEVVDAWNAALEALQKYNAVNRVPQIHDELHEKGSSGGSGGSTVPKKPSGKKDKDKEDKDKDTSKYKAIHTVKYGDTLWSIAQKYYGDMSKWGKIKDANPNYFSSSLSKKDIIEKTQKIIGKKLYIPYKNGTLSVPRDSLALIDEAGEELVLHANEHGKLTRLTKGSSVIPADITERLLAWAQNAPDIFSSNLRRHIPDLPRPDNRTWGKPTVTIGDIYINGNMGSLTRADLADFRKDIVNDVYESMQKNRVKSGRY